MGGVIVPRRPAAPAAVAGHYDTLDAWYREIWCDHLHHGLFTEGRGDPVETATRRLAFHVADLARIARGDRVVDVGCGYGATSRLLAAERGARPTGYTLSTAQADYARTRRPVVDVRVENWLENDEETASADAVIAIESLSHMPDKERAFAEIARVLKPGGRLVVCDWLARTERSGWRDRWLLEPICAEGHLPSMHTAAEYGALMAGAGLAVTSFADVSRRVSRTWTLVVVRALARMTRDPDARRFLLGAENPERRFALTIFRLVAAFATRAMVYGVVAAQKAE
jgi:cyclopropane fatty-acyl-phospholipid synthase-like methyltransferase